MGRVVRNDPDREGGNHRRRTEPDQLGRDWARAPDHEHHQPGGDRQEGDHDGPQQRDRQQAADDPDRKDERAREGIDEQRRADGHDRDPDQREAQVAGRDRDDGAGRDRHGDHRQGGDHGFALSSGWAGVGRIPNVLMGQ